MAIPDKNQSIGTLIAVGLVSAVASVATKTIQESTTHNIIRECGKLANKTSDQWLHDWHAAFGQCIESQFQNTLKDIRKQ